MKNRKLQLMSLALGALLITSDIKAQWYGQNSYQHDNVILSSGKRTPRVGGYAMGSFWQTRGAGGNIPDIAIDKIDPTVVADQLWEYQIQRNCNGVLTSGFNCKGITVIQNSTYNGTGSSPAYVMVCASSSALYFATLGAGGNIIVQRAWNIPLYYTPVIRESAMQPGVFYICASDGAYSYVIKITAAGNQLWGHKYFSSKALIDARDIIESPYSTPISNAEVIVVGHTDESGPTTADSFFMRLNANNGVVLWTKVYNYHPLWVQPKPDSDDWFSSIEVAQSPTGGQGFVIGGRALTGKPGISNLNYMQLVCKLDPVGNIIWTSLIESSVWNGAPEPEICRVQERYNANTSAYEYYAVSSMNGSLAVYKLNDAGTTAGLTPTEFHYAALTTPDNGTPLIAYGDLTLIETGGGTDDGFQAYGTTITNPSHDMIVKAYFNGVSGCGETVMDIYKVHQEEWDTVSYLHPQIIDIDPCNNANFIVKLNTNIQASTCMVSSDTNGSNARLLSVNELGRDEGMNIYPNPTKGIVNVELGMINEDRVKIAIYNNLGQLVKTIPFNVKDKQEINIDFNALQVESGFYTIQVKAGNHTKTFKAIYNPE